MVFSLNGFSFTLVELIVWVVVAAICGGIAEALVGYSPGGILASIGIGLVGAFIGSWLGRQLGLPQVLSFEYGGARIELLWTILGAVLFVAVLSLIRRPRRVRTVRRRYS